MISFGELDDVLGVLETILTHMQVGLLVVSPDLKIRAVSEVASVALGKPRTELIGQSLNSIREGLRAYRADGTPASHDELPISRAVREGVATRGEEWMFENASGVRTHSLVSADPVRSPDGTIIGGVVSWTDVSNLKVMEADLRNALDVETILLQESNHRIKNHFQMIAMLVQMEAARLGPENQKLATRVSERLSVLATAHEQLYTSGLKDGVNAGAFLEGIIKTYEGYHLSVTYDTEPLDLPGAQVTPIALAVNEAINNAVKHAFPDGRPRRIEVGLRRVPGNRLTLTIADSGIGIDGSHRPGLGLRLLRALAGQLSGVLDIGRAPRGGTLVRLTFPEIAAEA